MKEQLIREYEKGYERVRQALEGLSVEEMSFKPAPNKWSIHEIVVHLADAELVGVQRMKKVLAEERPLLTGYDQDGWANSLAYPALDWEMHLQLFKGLRESMLPVLARAQDADWERVGMHEEAGPLTLLQLVERYVGHVSQHLAQIERVKAAYNSQSGRV